MRRTLALLAILALAGCRQEKLTLVEGQWVEEGYELHEARALAEAFGGGPCLEYGRRMADGRMVRC